MSSNDPIEPQLAAIPDRASVGLTRDDTHEPDTKIPPSRPSRSAASAPNVLVVLVEDVGFGPSSAFGGPCETPIAERLAERGLRYTRFHTTGLCATTRAALLGAGAPLVETLELNGYATAQFDAPERAVHWIKHQNSVASGAPFFVYFAAGATSTPHDVPDEWIAKYEGKFDHGWDGLREDTLARQMMLGAMRLEWESTRGPDRIPVSASTERRLRLIVAAEMEIHAAFLEFADYQVGCVVDCLDELELLDDTLVVYVIGDSGGSGGTTAPHPWRRRLPLLHGATRNGTIVHWPAGIRARGELRTQFHHVIDVAPTIFEVAELSEPSPAEGVEADPLRGVSMVYSFEDADAPERHDTRCFETLCCCGICRQGFASATRHDAPARVPTSLRPSFDDASCSPTSGDTRARSTTSQRKWSRGSSRSSNCSRSRR